MPLVASLLFYPASLLLSPASLLLSPSEAYSKKQGRGWVALGHPCPSRLRPVLGHRSLSDFHVLRDFVPSWDISNRCLRWSKGFFGGVVKKPIKYSYFRAEGPTEGDELQKTGLG